MPTKQAGNGVEGLPLYWREGLDSRDGGPNCCADSETRALHLHRTPLTVRGRRGGDPRCDRTSTLPGLGGGSERTTSHSKCAVTPRPACGSGSPARSWRAAKTMREAWLDDAPECNVWCVKPSLPSEVHLWWDECVSPRPSSAGVEARTRL